MCYVSVLPYSGVENSECISINMIFHYKNVHVRQKITKNIIRADIIYINIYIRKGNQG